MEKIMNKKTTTINKLYYTDPLAIVYMAREFGVKFIWSNPDKEGYLDIEEYDPEDFLYPDCIVDDEGIMWERLDVDLNENEMDSAILDVLVTIQGGGKICVSPDSYSVFEPQVGDLIIRCPKERSSCHYCGMDWLNDIEDEDDMLEYAGCKIIQRNGKPFFMPEVE